MLKEEKKRGPKPDFEITEKVIQKITEMSGLMTQTEMHQFFGIGKTLWYEKKASNPEMAAAIKSGETKKKMFVASKLMQEIRNGNVTAMIFYLKTKAKWCEKKKVEISASRKLMELPSNLGVDPVAAAQKYKEIMGS
jgi:hypothetical protein